MQDALEKQTILFKHTLSSMQMIFEELGMEITKGQSFAASDNLV